MKSSFNIGGSRDQQTGRETFPEFGRKVTGFWEKRSWSLEKKVSGMWKIGIFGGNVMIIART